MGANFKTYIKQESFLDVSKKTGSVTWNVVIKARAALKDGFEFRLGN